MDAATSPVRLPSDDAELLALARPEGLVPGQAGLFGDDSWMRRVSGESVVLFGGGRALLLEVAHPLVAAGVAEHSDFRTDPLGRLRRTLDAMNAIAFGSIEMAVAAARGIERAHARVRGALREPAGRFPAGTTYHGRDPELVCWVWATLADTALGVFECFVHALEPSQREAYYADHRVMARLLGVPPELVPESFEAFRAYFDALIESDTLAVTATSRAIAAAVLWPPGDAGGAKLVRAVTSGLLPDRLRRQFELRWDEGRAARFDALVQSVRGLRRPSEASPTAPAPAKRAALDARDRYR